MNESELITTYPREATVAASVCAVFFCIVGVLGNFITILALVRSQKLRVHATTYFVLSLCLSDLIFCSVNLPLTASRYIHEEWRFGDALCKVFPVILYGNVALSLLNMVAITINRYMIISCYEYYNKFYTKTSLWIQLVSIWIASFLIMLPPLLGIWGELGLHGPTFSCTILQKDGNSPKKFIFLVGFVLPCVVIIVSYTCIYVKVLKSKRNLQAHQQGRSKESRAQIKRDRDDRRLTRLMVVIFACFVVCFLPLMCVNVFDDDVGYPSVHVFASVMAWASSVVNPFIYAASNKQYRVAYGKLFNIVKSSISVDSRNFSNSYKRSRVSDARTLDEC